MFLIKLFFGVWKTARYFQTDEMPAAWDWLRE